MISPFLLVREMKGLEHLKYLRLQDRDLKVNLIQEPASVFFWLDLSP